MSDCSTALARYSVAERGVMMEKVGWVAIIVAIIGACATVITTNRQEITKLNIANAQETSKLDAILAQGEVDRKASQLQRADELRSALVLSAIANPDPKAAAETLLFFVEIGLLGDELGAEVQSYLRTKDLNDALASFPSISPQVLEFFSQQNFAPSFSPLDLLQDLDR